MKRSPRHSILAWNAGKMLMLAALAVSSASAQDATKNTILQNKSDQQDLRQHTAVLATQIQSLIDELSDNGISGDDAKVLNTTKAVLNNLSAEEMQRVIASLQKAGDTAGTSDGEKNLVDAYGTQKGIILQFRQILKDYEQRQAADELPAKFKELTDRQTQVMWTTAQVATDIAGKSQSELNTMQQTTAQIVQSDQNALVNDVAMAKQMLDKAAQNATGDQGRAMQQAQKDLADGKLQAALDKANADLTAGHLMQATAEQKAARDMMRQLSKDLNPPTTTADALADFAATLTKIIDEQKDLLVQTNAAVDVKPRVTGLDSKQGILVDQTDSLQGDMQAMSPGPAALVKDAITPMQIARAGLGLRGAFPKAAASEQDAIDKLQQAAVQLNQQVAAAQKAADDAAKDSTQKLQELQQQIQQAMQAQKQVTQNTANAASASPPDPNAQAQAQQQQQQVAQATQAMQQTAAPLSLPTAQALSNAQQAMQQAQQAMSNQSQSQQAQQAQQAAQQALSQANQAVQQAIAQNQQSTADPSALAQAASQLQQAQSAVSSAQAAAQQASSPSASSPSASSPSASSPSASSPSPSTASASSPSASSPSASSPSASSPSASSPSASSPSASSASASPPGAAASMQQAQQALSQAAAATQSAAATPGLPDAAQSAVQSAQADIAQGQQAAAAGNAQATAAAASAAQGALAQAQAAVAVAQAGMSPSGSPSSGPPGSGPPGPPGGPPGSGPPGPPSSVPGMAGMTPTPPAPDSPSLTGAMVIGGGSTDKGQLHDVSGRDKFITVQSRERAAISETQQETRPQEYSPMIDQYLKNLSDQATASAQ